MKILQVLSTFAQGGAEHFVVELTEELIRQGYECDVVTLFDIERENTLKKIIDKRTTHISLKKRNGFDLLCLYKLYRLIKKRKYDVVHVHVSAIPYIVLSTILLPRVKFVSTIHSEAKRESGRGLMKWVRFFMFRNNLCTPVTISDESKDSFDKYYHMDAPMVYNGVSQYAMSQKLGLRDNNEQILFIHPASCQPVKNQELLIKSFALLVKDFPNSKMLWLGSNSEYPSLFNSLMNINLPQFEYLGVVSNVRDYLVQADAMCLSSLMEGMPMTIIEAFSVGCPPLCTPVGGVRNLIRDGINGMLSQSLAVDDYYRMLKRFCEQTLDERKQMRKEAYATFGDYSIRSTAMGYIQVYNNEL